MKNRGVTVAALAVLIFLVSIACPVGALPSQPASAISTKMILKVTDPERSADLLAEKADALGGYFVLRNNSCIKVKIPAGAMEGFLKFSTDQGIVLTREQSSEDLNAALFYKKSLLKSKTEIKTQYLNVLKEAKVEAVVMVENEITNLVHEIETLKGEIRMIEHRLSFAEALIEFRFKDRSTPTAQGPSSFPWLNNINISDLLKAFQYGRY